MQKVRWLRRSDIYVRHRVISVVTRKDKSDLLFEETGTGMIYLRGKRFWEYMAEIGKVVCPDCGYVRESP